MKYESAEYKKEIEKGKNKRQKIGLPWWSSSLDCAPDAGGAGSIPSWRTEIPPHAVTKKKKKEKLEGT